MENITTVIDIGNGYIKAGVFGQEDDGSVLLAKSLKITKGLRNGKVLDKEALKQSINEIIAECEKKVGEEYVDEIVIWLSHPQLKPLRIQEQKRIIDGDIQKQDIHHLSAVVTDTSHRSWYEILKIVPQHRIIDEKTKTNEPLGKTAKKLDLVADSFVIPSNYFNTINEIIEELDLYVIDIIPTILGTAEATLNFDTRDLGALSIDIGKNQTAYCIYENGTPIYYQVVPLGGENITKDISIWLQIDVNEAENIKINYGQLLHEQIKLEETDNVNARFLANIISARYEELLQIIEDDLKRIDKDGRLPWWVFLSWWWAKMSELEILARDIFKVNALKAQNNHTLQGEAGNNLQFITTIWLYFRSNKYSVAPSKKRWLPSFNTNILWSLKKIMKNIF